MSLAVNQLIGFGARRAAASATASIVYVTNAVNAGNASSYTFTATSIGTAASDRIIVVAVGTGVASQTVSSLTIGGVSATQQVTRSSSETASLHTLAVAAGTTADIVVTLSASCDFCGIAVWAMYGVTSATATHTSTSASDPGALSLNISAGGVAVAYQIHRAGAETFTWTNATENFDALVESAIAYHSGASDAFASAQTGLAITGDPSTSGIRAPLTVGAAFF